MPVQLKISDEFLVKVKDKMWKVRNEALDELETLVNNKNQFISNSIPIDFIQSVSVLFKDINKNIAIRALTLMTSFGTLVSTQYCTTVASHLYKNCIPALSDTKPQLREAALSCFE